MKLPRNLFGTGRLVNAEARKVMRSWRRGETLEQIFAKLDDFTLEDHPRALISQMNGLGGLAGEHFRPASFSAGLLGARLPHEEWNRFRDESIVFLASSPWGALVLNSGQAYPWAYDLPLLPRRPNRRAFVEILRATARFWDAFEELGSRFHAGLGPVRFDGTLPLGGHLAAICGPALEIDRAHPTWTRLVPIHVEADLAERLETDDDFWREVASGRSRGLEPEIELTAENLELVEEACRRGSPRVAEWAFLGNHRGAEGVEAALAAVVAREDWKTALLVLVHVLHDTKRAAQLLLARDELGSELGWARDPVVAELERADPVLAASLLFQEAEMYLGFEDANVYRASANRLREARDLLDSAAHRPDWTRRIAEFRVRHAGRKPLIELLHRLGL